MHYFSCRSLQKCQSATSTKHPSHILFNSKELSQQIQFIQKLLMQLRHQLLTDTQYIPQKHYQHLCSMDLSPNSQSISISVLNDMQPRLPQEYVHLKLRLLPFYIPKAIQQLNDEARLSYTPTQQKIKFEQRLNYNGYLNLIKEAYPLRTVLSSEFNKTIHHRLTVDKTLDRAQVQNKWHLEKQRKKFTKFDDIFGLMFFLYCLFCIEMHPGLYEPPKRHEKAAVSQYYNTQKTQLKKIDYAPFPLNASTKRLQLNQPIFTSRDKGKKSKEWIRPKIFKSLPPKQTNNYILSDSANRPTQYHFKIRDKTYEYLDKFISQNYTKSILKSESSSKGTAIIMTNQETPKAHQHFLREKWFTRKNNPERLVNKRHTTSYI